MKSNFKQVQQHTQVMETETIQKNGASPKSQTSKRNIFTVFFVLGILCSFFACNKDEHTVPDLNDNTEMLKDAIFYHEADFEEDLIIYLNENNEEVSLFAFKGFVIVYFQDNVKLESANQTIAQLGGTVVEKIPAFNYYLVQVPVGREANFIEKIQSQEIEYVSPYLIFEPNYYTAIIDDHRTNKTHGSNVLSVYNGCSSHSSQTFLSKINVGGSTNSGVDYIDTQEGLNFLITNNEAVMAKANLVNMSFGPKRSHFPNDRSYYSAMKKQIKQVITRIKKMKKYRTDNIVFTIAAGNDGLPIYDNVIKPLTTGLFPELSAEERAILKDNILVVGAIDAKDPSYSNTSSKDNAFAMVDISDLSLYGTSFAAPRALCYISQVMEMQKDLTAVEALAAVKEAIKNNVQGEFDLEEALVAARGMYLNQQYVDVANTSWNIPSSVLEQGSITITFRANHTCTGDDGVVSGTGVWSQNKNLLTFNIVHITEDLSEYLNFTAEINSPTDMSGRLSGKITFDGETEYYSDTFVASKVNTTKSASINQNSKSGNPLSISFFRIE